MSEDAGTSSLHNKFDRLTNLLREAGDAVLAFSGGVDSSFLLKAMKISGMRVLAVTGASETMPENELKAASAFAKEAGVEHVIIRTEELSNEEFSNNPPDRCFFCKDGLFRKLRSISSEKGFGYIFDAANSDDLLDYRPGKRAALLHGVRSPLSECNFSKAEVRAMSKELGLSTWNKPSSPCLSSRFPYGQRITIEGLRRVEKAEQFLGSFALRDLRVRNHGDTARIEVAEEDMHIILKDENRRRITEELKSMGYKFIALDLEGYKTGSLNRVLEAKEMKS